MAVVSMSKREFDRLEVLMGVQAGRLRVADACALSGLSRRQVFRLLQGFREDGAVSLLSKRRGRPSNRRLPDAVRDLAMALVREHYADFGPTLAAEKLAERHGCTISRETLRGWMIAAGMWVDRRHRLPSPHQPRARRDCVGELVQIDGSEHAWFEDRGPRCTLLAYVDDATSRLMEVRFVASESAFSYFQATRAYVEAHGKPVAFYSDKHGVFRVNRHGCTGEELTQFGRALAELNIDILCADTPQAKGRVERVNRTLQDWLVKELRLAGIATVDGANAFLPGFIERFNARFAVSPARPGDLHRPLDLSPGRFGDILCHRELRHVGQQLTLAYDRKLFILTRNGITEAIAGEYVEIYHYADDQLDIRWRGHSLPYSVFDKGQRVGQGNIVENKRLGAALALVKAQQEIRRPPPRLRTSSEAGGYQARPRRRAGPLSAAPPTAAPR